MTEQTMAGEIFFRCDAGRQDGLGHLSRCLTLAEGMKQAGRPHPVFLTHAPDGMGRDIAAQRGFEVRDLQEPAGTATDRRSVVATLADSGKEKGVKPVIVVDSKRIDDLYAGACRNAAVTVCLDDELHRDLPCDILVNNNAWVGAKTYPDRSDRQLLLGLLYNLVPQDFFGDRPSTTRKRLSILVTLGGEDPGDHTSWCLRTLGDLLAPHRVTVVIGPAHPKPQAVRDSAAETLPDAQLVEAPRSLQPYIRAADLAITAGGTTCYELAAARVPQLAIVIEDHQERLIAALAGAGCLECLGRHDALAPDAARAMLARYLDEPAARTDLSAAARRILPDSGVDRLVQAITDTYQQVA